MDLLATPPASEPTPPTSGPACVLCGGRDRLVHWLRRLTDDELAAHIALEQQKRDQRLLLADPQKPVPDFGPMPQADDCTTLVFACGPHAITIDAASLIHASTCTAPNEADLPDCDCTPEPPPVAPTEETPGPGLPDHWVTGGA